MLPARTILPEPSNSVISRLARLAETFCQVNVVCLASDAAMRPENRSAYVTFVYECVINSLTHDDVTLSQPILVSNGVSDAIILPMIFASIHYRAVNVFKYYLEELLKTESYDASIVTILAEVLRSTADIYLAFKQVVEAEYFDGIVAANMDALTNCVAYSYYKMMTGDVELYEEVSDDIPFIGDDFERVGLSEAIECDDVDFVTHALTSGCTRVPTNVVISDAILKLVTSKGIVLIRHCLRKRSAKAVYTTTIRDVIESHASS
jgi:hypothetical protein